MIKLQTHVRQRHPEKYVRNLAKEHWLYLKKQSGPKLSITTKVDQALQEALTPNYLSTVAEQSPAKQAVHVSFLNELKANNFSLLERLIVGRPSELEKLRKQIFKNFSKSYFVDKKLVLVRGRQKTVSAQTPFSAWLMSNIFNYGSFRKSSQCRNMFLNLGFKSATCPYCNYSMIDIADKKLVAKVGGKEKAYVEADHFFEKYQHPFFALSFFNLIPSCHNCNAMDKGGSGFSLKTHINPYSKTMDDIYRFRITDQEILNGKIDQVTVDCLRAGDRTFDDFNILVKYNNNLASANKILKKFLNNMHLARTAAHADFLDVLFENVANEKKAMLDHPKSKLHRDILRELDPMGNFGLQHALAK